jgi:hypothetical protein
MLHKSHRVGPSLDGEEQAWLYHVNVEISENIKEAENSLNKYLECYRCKGNAKLCYQRADLLYLTAL